ncbi:transmembrane protein [Anaeramoeba ignava]|uniref:Transmembrane protein n=1 Tax=Anaeramoeba ignava TaxID=1746090 RepID=A0A9Q0R4Y5_ANAIG|nr:transmembrane protein [Anaeramoeba ignava]
MEKEIKKLEKFQSKNLESEFETEVETEFETEVETINENINGNIKLNFNENLNENSNVNSTENLNIDLNRNSNVNSTENLNGNFNENEYFEELDSIQKENSERYPFCIVWTPLPIVSWIVPFIGHVGICNSQGIIYDYAGSYFVSIDRMAFGNPTKFSKLKLNHKSQTLRTIQDQQIDLDNAIKIATDEFNKQKYSFLCNNCHCYVARVLDLLHYRNSTKWSNGATIKVMFHLIKTSKYISFKHFLKTYIGFFIFCILISILILWLKLG